MPERPTPRTDAFYNGPCKLPTSRRHREFARQLERELAEAREESLEQARLLGMGGQREAKLLGELAEAKDQRDRLAEALRDSMEFIPVTLQGPMRKALDSLD